MELKPVPTVRPDDKYIDRIRRNREVISQAHLNKDCLEMIDPHDTASNVFVAPGRDNMQLEITHRYYNGTGHTVTIFGPDGNYWKIPPSQYSTSGKFEIYTRIINAPGVELKRKPVFCNNVEDAVKEVSIIKAMRTDPKVLPMGHHSRVWKIAIKREELEREKYLGLSDLGLYLTLETDTRKIGMHPLNDNTDDGMIYGVFLNVTSGLSGGNLFTKIQDRIKVVPTKSVEELDDGVYYFVREDDKCEFFKVDEKDFLACDDWFKLPIFHTPEEAERFHFTSYSTREVEEATQPLHQEIGDLKGQLEKANLKLLQKETDTSLLKQDKELRNMEAKEFYMERQYKRQDNVDWLKFITTAVTVGFGLFKLLS